MAIQAVALAVTGMAVTGIAVTGIAVTGIALLAWAGWRGGLLGDDPRATLFLILLAGLWNAFLLLAVLLAWRRLTRHRTRLERLNEELRYFRAWGGEEGRLRKEGLIREINALGAAPLDLEQAVLAGCDLRGCNLSGCNLRGANLQGADLQGAVLDGANLWGADLAGANLNLAGLRHASLRGSNLEDANLAKAELEGVNLHRANLLNASFHGADLKNAVLERARFAPRAEGDFPQAVHPSVEDWIRERLDNEGFYRPPTIPEES